MTPAAKSAGTTLRWTLIGLGIFLPILTLIPLGSLWLWQSGWLIPWAIGATLTTTTIYLALRWLTAPTATRSQDTGETAGGHIPSAADPGWTPAEQVAWHKVQAIAAGVSPETLHSREAALALGLQTIEAVALSLKPERRDPLLQFTAPEALALIERVSTRMNGFVRDNVPFSDKLTVAQVVALYRWRGAIETAEKAYGVWRAIRVLNPATAIASELRERLSKEIMSWGREHIARRLASAFVEEIGRAAIDLYGGRLRLDPVRLTAEPTARSAHDLAAADTVTPEPLRILVAGQVSAGKSSLVNALAEEVKSAVDVLPATAQFTPYRLTRDGLPAALIVDSPGLKADTQNHDALCEAAIDTDLILWVSAANRADREPDRAALDAVRRTFAARPNRRPPPILLVLTHIDRLRPFLEWQPPYDLAAATSPKAASISAAVEAAAGDLGFATSDAIPACLAHTPGLYNVDALWARIGEQLPDAERARLVRVLRDAEGRWNWQQLWGQVVSGGRVLVKSAGRIER